ncbi:MAG: NfeD family protein [Pseudomonadota bacterium]
MQEFDLLAWLDGASAWWWIAFAVGLGAVEMATGTYFLLWIASAAAGTGVALLFVSDMSGAAQLVVFAVLSIVFVAAGMVWRAKRPAPMNEGPPLNARARLAIGRSGTAVAAFVGGEGAVMVDGVRWRARLADAAEPAPEAEQPLKVVDVDGSTLICERP